MTCNNSWWELKDIQKASKEEISPIKMKIKVLWFFFGTWNIFKKIKTPSNEKLPVAYNWRQLRRQEKKTKNENWRWGNFIVKLIIMRC